MVLHGPHHSAQKSTMTGLSEPATVSSKVEVERLTIPAMVAGSFVVWPQVGGRSVLMVQPVGRPTRIPGVRRTNVVRRTGDGQW